jgi:hypothetical protein
VQRGPRGVWLTPRDAPVLGAVPEQVGSFTVVPA